MASCRVSLRVTGFAGTDAADRIEQRPKISVTRGPGFWNDADGAEAGGSKRSFRLRLCGERQDVAISIHPGKSRIEFLQRMDKPDVDVIEGLSPAISIEQKATSHNPRSTVGTVTEIHDYLRLLYARAGTPFCPDHHLPLEAQSVSQMVDAVLAMPDESKLMVLAPVVRDRTETAVIGKPDGFGRILHPKHRGHRSKELFAVCG